MRAILRFSLDGDTGGPLMALLVPSLVGNGFTKTGTAKYEATAAAREDIYGALDGFWDAIVGYAGPGRLDHFWLYVDKQPAVDAAAAP
jgi:hypothetical protein